ncbi:mycofactocin-coupled SDR family oxidoreductase [Rhodococcus pseudokoreensis]|uniref:Mycofactocin-coupled SDR family oxidoreductase n=1 Tax=Rhodococcus pseudokoreensis TaxID=2811421 RepID=A0A974W8H2_9NOCA|nr:mycofactocin-coupled SDR family oxidoreductase [Rhodococcus pseudokoreensis]QSE92163.1 mycofactocin-coupled SDR family oxidoreductase [Rhodococcus pseudokoreensis]
MNRLDGKTAFITGGARGQGRAIAEKFAREGANIIVCDIDGPIEHIHYPLATAADLKETEASVERLGRGVVAEIADVRDQEQIDRVVAAGLDKFGHIDVVVANAGVLDNKPFWEMTDSEWKVVTDICLNGVWRTVKAVAPHMMERMRGSVILTSSTNGQEGDAGNMSYVAAKHGVIGVMKSAALALGQYNIRVNALLPGPVDTIINDNPGTRDRITGKAGATREDYLAACRNWHVLRGRSALAPEAVADGAIWLASDESRHVTGLEMLIDAGHRLLPGLNFDNDVVDEEASR